MAHDIHISECTLWYTYHYNYCFVLVALHQYFDTTLTAWNFAQENVETLEVLYIIIRSGDCPEVPLPLMIWQYAYHFVKKPPDIVSFSVVVSYVYITDGF